MQWELGSGEEGERNQRVLEKSSAVDDCVRTYLLHVCLNFRFFSFTTFANFFFFSSLGLMCPSPSPCLNTLPSLFGYRGPDYDKFGSHICLQMSAIIFQIEFVLCLESYFK